MIEIVPFGLHPSRFEEIKKFLIVINAENSCAAQYAEYFGETMIHKKKIKSKEQHLIEFYCHLNASLLNKSKKYIYFEK